MLVVADEHECVDLRKLERTGNRGPSTEYLPYLALHVRSYVHGQDAKAGADARAPVSVSVSVSVSTVHHITSHHIQRPSHSQSPLDLLQGSRLASVCLKIQSVDGNPLLNSHSVSNGSRELKKTGASNMSPK